MSLLSDTKWKSSYNSDDVALISDFYIPALRCAIRYHRATGYFTARALTLAVRGVEGLIRNDGRMRLLVGCTLSEKETNAIERGEDLKKTIESLMLAMPLVSENDEEAEALELLSWMIAMGYLEVRVAIPCDRNRKPCVSEGIFHTKSGVIEDKTGDRIAFSGSVNETRSGWGGPDIGGNWETLRIFQDFGDGNPHVRDIEEEFTMLWANKAQRALVIDVPTAVQQDLLKFLPEHDQAPRRLSKDEIAEARTDGTIDGTDSVSGSTKHIEGGVHEISDDQLFSETSIQRLIWGYIKHRPSCSDGIHIGEATSVVTPWPHQERTFQRLYDKWPPRLLIADEVGLGKTITAGMLLRQAWLAQKAKRILILAPKALLRQWQIELREKFNLNWPIYDGHRLVWYASPSLFGKTEREVSRTEWHREPFVITSSQLMRRSDRARDLIEGAEPWDMLVLDEAHHARRKGVGGPQERGPNQLLRLMQQLVPRTQGLLLLTATPMQVHPIEVWDLLGLLGLPPGWDEQTFVSFFERAAQENPSHDDFDWMISKFQDIEAYFGETPAEDVSRLLNNEGKLGTKKILAALRDQAKTRRRQLETHRRQAALKIMKANTPVSRLVSRNTRELLRRYYEAGKITTPVPVRDVHDEFVEMSVAERDLYEMVEDYISSTYNQAASAERNAVGFVMTIYRRRLSSSFAALAKTLEGRCNRLLNERDVAEANEEDISDDDITEYGTDVEELHTIETATLKQEEQTEIEHLLREIKKLPTDTKASVLVKKIHELREANFRQVMVFTQYTDTMDFLRALLIQQGMTRVLCFSGRGGEIPEKSGRWNTISREEVKRMFRSGDAEILLCTDAAAEGLNFQFCGALINYDMPWNPMRVEQRIGRIDRLGQTYPRIRIINLHYQDTVETDVYSALRERIDLFTRFVGKLQPILARLPGSIANAALTKRSAQKEKRDEIVSEITNKLKDAEQSGFDLDDIAASDLEVIPRRKPPYGMRDLDKIICMPHCLPPGIKVRPLAEQEYEFSQPGMAEPIRVTTNPEYFEAHPESTELWSPGSPAFPCLDDVVGREQIEELGTLSEILRQARKSFS